MSANRIKEVKFVGNQDNELLAQDNAGGSLCWGNWNSVTQFFDWTLITSSSIGPGWCETFDVDGTDSGDEEVVIPWYSTGGASIYDYSAGGTLSSFYATGYYVNFMVKADMYGRGYDSTMITAFGAGSDATGLHLYSSTTAGSWRIFVAAPSGL